MRLSEGAVKRREASSMRLDLRLIEGDAIITGAGNEGTCPAVDHHRSGIPPRTAPCIDPICRY